MARRQSDLREVDEGSRRMKIRKFWEGLDYGRISNRLDVIDPNNLPAVTPGSVWKEDEKFDERTAVSDDPSLQRVMDSVRRNGVATVDRLV
jgi:hypothetical protein